MGLYFLLIVLFLSFRIRTSRISYSCIFIFIFHSLLVFLEFFNLIFVQDIGISEILILVYVSFYVKLIIMVGSFVGFLWIYKRKGNKVKQLIETITYKGI
jgi:hypothetical protein